MQRISDLCGIISYCSNWAGAVLIIRRRELGAKWLSISFRTGLDKYCYQGGKGGQEGYEQGIEFLHVVAVAALVQVIHSKVDLTNRRRFV